MDALINQIPAALAIVLIVAKMVMDYYKVSPHATPNDGHASEKTILLAMNEKINKIGRLTDDLHDWHDKDDADGVKIWYVRTSLVDAIFKMTDAIDNQTRVMESVTTRLELLDADVRAVRAEVHASQDRIPQPPL